MIKKFNYSNKTIKSYLDNIGTKIYVKKNDYICKKDQEALSFFILLKGTVTIYQGNNNYLKLDKGSLFGEMSIFFSEKRTTDVSAVTNVELLSIPTNIFMRDVLKQEKVAINILQFLGSIMMERIQQYEHNLLNQLNPDDDETQKIHKLKELLISEWALKYHNIGKAGKIEIVANKPSSSTEDLAICYSPGVAKPCEEIYKNPSKAYDYTSKGHLVGVISNGSAILGLGNLGPLASKPVMEGKAILFKKFADIDAFDIEINESNPEKLVDIICSLEPTFGGINLEDIKSPECFYIEQEIQKRLSIPVFHDDQHGTAIIVAAGILNAVKLTNKKINNLKIVFSGIGAAGYTCAKYLLNFGISKEQIIMTDIDGVLYKGREKEKIYYDDLAQSTSLRTLKQAIEGADIFIGLSKGNILSTSMLKSMNVNPIIFALANPIPEINVAKAIDTRSDLIIATGRSDYPNQVNNVLAFPYLFKGALAVQASCINLDMKMAATKAIASLVHKPSLNKDLKHLKFGKNYIIPKPHDPRLAEQVTKAVAEAAVKTNVAKQN